MPLFQQSFRPLESDEISGLGSKLKAGLAGYTSGKNFLEDIRKKQLDNEINAPKAQYANEITLADLDSTRANTGLTKEQSKWFGATANSNIQNQQSEMALRLQQTLEQKLKNPFIPEREKAEIANTIAQSKYYAAGGGRGGVGAQTDSAFSNAVSQDNPQLSGDPDKIWEATNVLKAGGNTLSDGTKLNPLSRNATDILNRVARQGSTASLITAGVKSNQAEAEMPIIDQGIKDGRYGDTFMGYSPQQISDSLNTKDKAAQTRLGNYIASDMLTFDKALLSTKMAGAESGVTIVNELMDKAKQTIKAKYPEMSDMARDIALDKYSKVLRDAVNARNKYGIGAAGAVGRTDNTTSHQPKTAWGAKPDQVVVSNYPPNVSQLPAGKVEATQVIGNKNYSKINGQWWPS